jgi:hypothetical protein
MKREPKSCLVTVTTLGFTGAEGKDGFWTELEAAKSGRENSRAVLMIAGAEGQESFDS